MRTPALDEESGLICAYVLDGHGSGREIDWAEFIDRQSDHGLAWVHLDHTQPKVQRWLVENSGLDPVTARTLMQDDVRPRTLPGRGGLLVVLRGVNLNPGADPEDMVDIRVWLEPHRIITLRRRRLMAINDIRQALARRMGPRTTGDFLVALVERLTERMAPVINSLDDQVDVLEGEILTAQSSELRAQLGHIRRQTILIRRYLAPQRDALSRLPLEESMWLDDYQRANLRELGDRALRYLEDLDAARDRAAVIQEELNHRLTDQMNRTMYVLTIVAAVLLPPSLIAGLFGTNVGGMPGLDSPWGFAIVALAMAILGGIEIYVLKRLRLI